MKDPNVQKEWARERAALILTPLIKEIFHGDNRTSEKIHEELDKALDGIVALLASHNNSLVERLEGLKKDESGPNGTAMAYLGYNTAIIQAQELIKNSLT